VKVTIIALSAALIAIAPAALARSAPDKAHVQRISGKHHPGVTAYAPWHATQTMGSQKGYSGTSGYASSAPGRLDSNLESSRQAGGGGGGGGGM
jgi:hypothetical protein